MEVFIAIVDVGILAWLIGTWFFEGNHRRCKVEVQCPTCKQQRADFVCAAHRDPECQLPPHGWRCSRPAGHEGPCAASYYGVENDPRMRKP